MAESDDDTIPLNEETQIALPSDENERRLALPVVIPSVKLKQGTFDRANFGPQTNTKHIEANTIEHATITHIHHHYGDAKSQESPSTSGGTGASPKQKLQNGFVQITDDIFMNSQKPLKEGTKIYEGYQEHVTGQRQPLAIKAIIPCTKKSIREVQHLVKLAPHPNVVRIIRSKEHKGHLPTLYIVMELCGSKNLHDYLNENREKNIPFDFKKTMSYSKRLVKAMKHIHRNRIIHGDLKPENILFSLDGGQIKISDFGISKLLRQSRNATKMTSQGTDGYRAPETYSSDIISMMADIFSLGVTLYSLWTNGKHPFGENPYQQILNIINNTGRDLSGLPEGMGAKKDEFLDLLDKMLQVDPENRLTIEEISQHPFLSSSQATAQGYDPGDDSKEDPERESSSSSSDGNEDLPGTSKIRVKRSTITSKDRGRQRTKKETTKRRGTSMPSTDVKSKTIRICQDCQVSGCDACETLLERVTGRFLRRKKTTGCSSRKQDEHDPHADERHIYEIMKKPITPGGIIKNMHLFKKASHRTHRNRQITLNMLKYLGSQASQRRKRDADSHLQEDMAKVLAGYGAVKTMLCSQSHNKYLTEAITAQNFDDCLAACAVDAVLKSGTRAIFFRVVTSKSLATPLLTPRNDEESFVLGISEVKQVCQMEMRYFVLDPENKARFELLVKFHNPDQQPKKEALLMPNGKPYSSSRLSFITKKYLKMYGFEGGLQLLRNFATALTCDLSTEEREYVAESCDHTSAVAARHHEAFKRAKLAARICRMNNLASSPDTDTLVLVPDTLRSFDNNNETEMPSDSGASS